LDFFANAGPRVNPIVILLHVGPVPLFCRAQALAFGPLSALADDDRADHVRVQGAEVLVGAGLVEPEAEAIAGVERLRLEVAGRTDDEMRL
jgi:hypothetical protein